MSKTVGIWLGLFVAFAAGGCYNTLNVKNGGLVCGPNDACPDGFQCIKDGQAGQPGHCWRNGSGPDAGGTGSDTSAVKPDVANPLACTLANAVPPFGPFPSDKCNVVSPDQWPPGTCDPVCQEGCPCKQRCVLAGTYDRFECEGQPPPALVDVQASCTGSLSNSCTPGSVCIRDDVCPWLCFRTCRKDLDCGTGSRCSGLTIYDQSSKPVPNVALCTPPIESCNPAGTASCATARTGFGCVFLAGLTGIGTTDATVCDCRTTHDKAVGAACSMLPDDCQPGAVCVDGTCRQICDKNASGSACPSGGGCNTIYGSTRFGYCR